MSTRSPQVIVLGGPNGAGKTTIAREVLVEALGVCEFVNADMIATGLSGFAPERASFAAGRLMLARLRELSEASPPRDFAFESTLSSRIFAPWLSKLAARGFAVHILYVWVRSPEIALRRVRARVRSGGHGVPAEIVRRRFARSAANLIQLYVPIAERAGSWRVYDNSARQLRVVAHGGRNIETTIVQPRVFAAIAEAARRI